MVLSVRLLTLMVVVVLLFALTCVMLVLTLSGTIDGCADVGSVVWLCVMRLCCCYVVVVCAIVIIICGTAVVVVVVVYIVGRVVVCCCC